MKNKIHIELKKAFNPEFLNRIDDIIIFHPLEKSHIEKIVDIQLSDVQQRLKDKNIILELEPSARDFLIDKGYDKMYGARQMKRTIQRYVEDAVAEELLRGHIKDGQKVILTSGGDKLVFTTDATLSAVSSAPAATI
jgi:ATP-dependent Clp protease ATP-binding subunit ClpC